MPQFKLPFKKQGEDRFVANSICNEVPGPGAYTPRETSQSNKYRNTYDFKLHKYDRKIELHDKTKLNLPGPQQYILPSDFGNGHLASTTSFTIPQNMNRKVRTRNNALLHRTKSTNLMQQLNSTISHKNTSEHHRLKPSFTQIVTPKVTE